MADLLLTLARRAGAAFHGIAEWITGEPGDRRPWDMYIAAVLALGSTGTLLVLLIQQVGRGEAW